MWCIWKNENDFWELNNIIFIHDTAIKMVKFTIEV